MRILLTHRPGGAYAYVSDGWLNALRSAGFNAHRWDGSVSTWHQFKPDLYIGCSGHRQTIPNDRGNTKIAIHVNPYGTKSIKGIDEARHAIDWVLTQKPDVVFGYGHRTDEQYWNLWYVKHGIPWVPMATAGDITLFDTCSDRPRDIEIGYLGGRWPYKAQNIDRYMTPLREQADVVIYGWGGWPKNTSRGRIEDEAVPDFYRRCLVCPCISEPHTTEYGIDLPERMFKASLSGALVVHDPVAGLMRYMSSVVMAQDEYEFAVLCGYWSNLARRKERDNLAEEQRRQILAEHTYHHRLAGLFTKLGFDNAARLLLDDVKQLTK